jgi:N-acetylneuraminate synthase
MMGTLRLASRIIGPLEPPFIIAEMSGNHNQSLDRALEIVDAAATLGADAIKIQTYTPDTMTLKLTEGDFRIEDPNSLWHGQSLYELYRQAHTPWEWHQAIFQRAREKGIIAFSTPFDETAVDFLESIGCPFYKIASFENTDFPLIRKVAATGKPMIISTGMASVGEIDEMTKVAREAGCKDIVLLKCTSTYPASPMDSNIVTITHMREFVGCPVGLSDHTPGIGVAVAAVALGASVIEKHFTLSRAEGGVDAAFSLEPSEFKLLVEEVRRAWASIGRVIYGGTASEEKSKRFRRSIYVSEDLSKDTVLGVDNMRIIRPGFGLAPKYFSLLVGKRISRDTPKGTPLSWDLVR